jgi:hypothetical protein
MAVPDPPGVSPEEDVMADPVRLSEAASKATEATVNGEAPFPVRLPSAEEWEDWDWVLSHMALADFDPYRGKHVAVYQKRVLGSGDHPERLREAVAAEHHVDLNRLVVMYIEGLDD